MERAIRIANLWNWLPAFRTVAETQNLGTAARTLHVSPSALSRSVKQLEDVLGQPLFIREKARIRLNVAGSLLLAAVRDAMRRVDDGVAQLGSASIERVRISGQSAWLDLIVFPALVELEASGTRVVVDVVEVPGENIASSLLRGDLDLALCEAFDHATDLVVHHLGAVALALCQRAGRGAHDPDLPFAICVDGPDPWPGEIRRVAIRTRQLATVVQACAAGRAQAVLPRALARAHRLRVVGTGPLPDAQLYLARRRPLLPTTLDEVAEAVTRRAASVLGVRR